jgi:hypothetical protein
MKCKICDGTGAVRSKIGGEEIMCIFCKGDGLLRIELKQYGSDYPCCPVCDSGNAMFDRENRGENKFWHECRDCGFKVDAWDSEIVFYDFKGKRKPDGTPIYEQTRRKSGEAYFRLES